MAGEAVKILKRRAAGGAVALLVLVLAGLSLSCGSDSYQSASSQAASGLKPAIDVTDIRLIADFPHQILFSRGERISFDSLQMLGSAHIDPGQGMSVYKGGINEITDPSFEGSGWSLAPGASIDSGSYSSGRHSLLISGNGASGVKASLKEPVKVISGPARTLSFDELCAGNQGGAVRVVMNALGSRGEVLGSQSSTLGLQSGDWRRVNAFIFNLPEGTAAYNIEIVSDGFSGNVNLDAFLSEPKDFFTPYFDGDCDNSLWVDAATPQNFAAAAYPLTRNMMWKGITASFLSIGGIAVICVVFVNGYGRRHRLRSMTPLLIFPIALMATVSLGAARFPGSLPLLFSMQGSYLKANSTYYYRISSIDASGRESPPSAESRIKTGWLGRRVLLAWDRDPNATKYRIYRGNSSYAQDSFYEVDASSGAFIDVGGPAQPGSPVLELGADSATPNASRSLRPEPDASISNTVIGLDTTADFWVTGEVQFNFSSANPFRPASLFEIGNPDAETQFAVSTRYFPGWGDEYSKILLIKAKGSGDYNYAYQPLDIKPGAVIRYVAAQLYQPNGGLAAGVHLWYRIDSGELNHIYVNDTSVMDDWPSIRISKRYYYDEFGNNSICRSFAIVQGKIDDRVVAGLMAPGAVSDLLGRMAQG